MNNPTTTTFPAKNRYTDIDALEPPSILHRGWRRLFGCLCYFRDIGLDVTPVAPTKRDFRREASTPYSVNRLGRLRSGIFY